jgi:hypothetical protein
MRDLLDNTWQDLREKRLWPVALVLALAIVAIPVLLTKSAAAPRATVPVAPPTDAREQVSVKLDDGDAGSTGAGSALDEFAEGDPFTPPNAIAQVGAGAAETATLAGAAEETVAGPEGGGTGDVPSSSPDGPTGVAPPTTRTETAEYQYVADITFWNGDRRRKIRGLRKLDMLPNQNAPVLIFMGTSAQGGNAVFLVDSTLKAAGEGQCVPRPANCVYVHIGPGSEHSFSTVEGDSYRVRIDEIRRIKVDAASASGRPRARTSVGGEAATRRFELPSLADLVAITETTTTPASTADSSVSPDGR